MAVLARSRGACTCPIAHALHTGLVKSTAPFASLGQHASAPQYRRGAAKWDVAEENVEATDNMEDAEPKLESSIWNDDFDEDEQVELNEPDEIPPRSGWTPEPPEPETKQEEGPIKVIYSFLNNNNNKREARDLSIEDIFCTITSLRQQEAPDAGPVLYRGSPDQQRDHQRQQPSQMSDDNQWSSHQQQQENRAPPEKRQLASHISTVSGQNVARPLSAEQRQEAASRVHGR